MPGGRTHIEMGLTAINSFLSDAEGMLPGITPLFDEQRSLLPSLRTWYYCGCLFPDWVYYARFLLLTVDGYEKYPDVAHWQTFWEIYAKYIVDTYGTAGKPTRDWSLPALQSAAFMLGVVSHGMQDLNWHFIGDPLYPDRVPFETKAADEDHTAPDADKVVDIFVPHGQPMITISDLSWPLADIQAVYKLIPPSTLRDGSSASAFVPSRLNAIRAFLQDVGGATAKKMEQPRASVPVTLLEGLRLTRDAMVLYINTAVMTRSELYFDGFTREYPWHYRHYRRYFFGALENGSAGTCSRVREYYAALQRWSCLQQEDVLQETWHDYRPYRGVADAHLLAALPDNNTGYEPMLEVGNDSQGQDVRALLRFDLSSVPPDRLIQKATLWIWYFGTRGPSLFDAKRLALYQVNRAWSEGQERTGDEVNGDTGGVASPGEVTWTAARKDVDAWAVAGCDGVPSDRDGTPAATMIVPGSWIEQGGDVQAFMLDGDRLGILQGNATLSVKEGSLSAKWDLETNDVVSFQLEGKRIGALQREGKFSVKDGPLYAKWEPQAGNVVSFQLEGKRIGILQGDARFSAKEGALDRNWVPELGNAVSFQLDGTRIGVLQRDGKFSVKEGKLDADWRTEADNVASFQLSGNRIGALQRDGKFLVKEGPLNTKWFLAAEDVASFQLWGYRIGILQRDGTLSVKEGPLDAPWGTEAGGVSSFQLDGDRIAMVQSDGTFSVKEGPLKANWLNVAAGVVRVQLSGSRIAVLLRDNSLWAVEGTPAPLPRWLTVDLTTLVRSWIANPATNFGLLLKGTTDAARPAIVRFLSSQSFKSEAGGDGGGARTAYRPMLIIR